MKRRIDQLINEIFEYEAPGIQISETEISVSVKKGEIYRGSFQVESPIQKKIKGFIYSSSARVGYEPDAFYGISEKVVYEVDTAGMEEGEVLSGVFTICTDAGEYRIPYRVEIERSAIKTSTAVIGNMEDFIKLAQEDFQKAYLIFVSPGFSRLVYEENPQWISLYEGLTAQSVNYSSLEEFLIGLNKKSAIWLQADKEEAVYRDVKQQVQESLVLSKSTWGFMRLEISSDAPFLKVERPLVTTDEFIGSTYQMEYLIDPGLLHPGRNWGRIAVKTPFQTLEFQVLVHCTENGEVIRAHLAQQRQVANLLSLYIDFRLRRIHINAWITRSQEALEEYRQAGGTHTMLDLFQAQLFFAADKQDAACMILENLDQHKERLNTPEILGYYLYLTTFYHKDKEYIDYVEEQVSSLFLQNPENWKLQWFLLYLQENLMVHPAEKLEAILQQYVRGCRSRIMYLEAYHTIEKSPLLLKKLGDFEIQVLKFICREKLLSGEIIMQISDLAGRHKEYSKELYEILRTCYQVRPSNGLLHVICSLLIKGHKTGSEYFTWYERGVDADLRITGLYEYYVDSLGGQEGKPLPKMIRMYFSYNNALDYRKKAQVYANVVKNRERDPQTYQSYRPMIEKFMVDQLTAGKISKDLAFLYGTFLTRSVLNRKMAQHLTKAFFTYELQCDQRDIHSVIVMHKQLKKEQRTSVSEGRAYIQLYTPDYQIFLEDGEGIRHARSISFTLTRILENSDFMEYCRELAPESPGLVLYTCGMADGENPVNSSNAEQFGRLLDMEEVKDTYKEEVRRNILDYYYDNQGDESLYEYLHNIDYDIFIRTDKKKLVELLTAEGMCREAFELVSKYGPEKVSPISLVRMCSRNILSREYEADEMLVSICYFCFEQGKYDETVLAYLLRYYDGPVESMKTLWKAGRKFELDTMALEEKILMVLLFVRCGAQDTEEIFDSYRRKLGRKKLLLAYVIYRSYDYFVKEIPVKNQVFEYIERGYEKGKITQDICLLAMLLWYTRRPTLEKYQQENAQELVEGFLYRGLRFAFYKKFEPALIRAFQLQDKSFIEYRTNPRAAVSITYYKEDRKGEKSAQKTELMKPAYEGVFEREFTLFYGEKIVYHIDEELNGVVKNGEELVCAWSEKNSTQDKTRYDLINQIAEHLKKKEEQAARTAMRTYLEQECLVDRLFTLT